MVIWPYTNLLFSKLASFHCIFLFNSMLIKEVAVLQSVLKHFSRDYESKCTGLLSVVFTNRFNQEIERPCSSGKEETDMDGLSHLSH
jgi:hypothetical protein